jgi:hypothetical protein
VCAARAAQQVDLLQQEHLLDEFHVGLQSCRVMARGQQRDPRVAVIEQTRYGAQRQRRGTGLEHGRETAELDRADRLSSHSSASARCAGAAVATE